MNNYTKPELEIIEIYEDADVITDSILDEDVGDLGDDKWAQ